MPSVGNSVSSQSIVDGGDASALLARMPPRYSHVVRDRALADPDRPALRVGDAQLTYAELWAATEAAIQKLRPLDIRAGDRVLVVAENGLQIVVLLLALSEIDAWAVPLNARMSAREVETIRAFVECRRAFYCVQDSVSAREHAEAAGAASTVGMLGEVIFSDLNVGAASEQVHADKADQTAVLVFTSGTTGEPKGVMLSHQALMYMGANMVELRGITPDDVFYNSSPVSHAIGLGTVLMTAFWAGASTELVARFTPRNFVAALKAERITCVTSVPTLFARILEYAEANGISLKSKRLRVISTAGAPLDVSMKRRAENAFGIPMGNSYGMTECLPIARSRAGVETNEVGDVQPGTSMKIVGDDGEPVAIGASGQILAKTPSLMQGYFRNPEATVASFRNGWLATGDLGRLDAQGRLFIVGRTKDLIIRSGFNVYPVEVESVIGMMPGVGQVAVVGRDIEANEEVVAFVQPLPGATVSSQQVIDWAGERLAPYKRPTEVVIMPELPIGPTGKVFKIRLKQIASNGSMAHQPGAASQRSAE